jgi:ATP-dependent RNA helicase DDX55/SPB4
MAGRRSGCEYSTVFSAFMNHYDHVNPLQWDTYSYADQAQETKRVTNNLATTNTGDKREKVKKTRADSRKINSAWSDHVARREARDLRKEKKTRKRKWLKTQTSAAVTAGIRGKSAADSDDDDWDDLAQEERMAKKVRSGDVCQKAFDAEFANL